MKKNGIKLYPIIHIVTLLFIKLNLVSCQFNSIKPKKMMEKKYIIAPGAPSAIGPYSHAVLAGNFLFISGQIGINPETNEIPTDFEAETHQVMKNVGTILQSQGLNYDDIVKSTIFLIDMGQFPTVNQIYGSYFKEGSYPARETVEVSKLPKNVRVEISVIAFKK